MTLPTTRRALFTACGRLLKRERDVCQDEDRMGRQTMKTRSGKGAGRRRQAIGSGAVIRAGILEAREIHLVAGDGGGRRRLSITLDKKTGYPMIRMGDIDGPGENGTKMIEIGFSDPVGEYLPFPYVKLSVGRASWDCSTMSVVDRVRDRKRETYPETSMSRQGGIRTYYKVDPDGVASLELWGAGDKRFTVTGNGIQATRVLEDGRCICANETGCAKPDARQRGKKRRLKRRVVKG